MLKSQCWACEPGAGEDAETSALCDSPLPFVVVISGDINIVSSARPDF